MLSFRYECFKNVQVSHMLSKSYWVINFIWTYNYNSWTSGDDEWITPGLAWTLCVEGSELNLDYKIGKTKSFCKWRLGTKAPNVGCNNNAKI